MTRMPRVSDSATFSAGCRHTLHPMNSASPSFHSPDWRSKVRGVEATVKFATAAPDGVKRSSGSAVRLPTTVMTVSPAMSARSRGGALALEAQDLGAQHGLVEPQLAVELGDGGRLAGGLEEGVDALDVLLDLVGEAALAPHLDLLDRTAVRTDNVQEGLQRRLHGALVETRVEDDQQLVVTHENHSPPMDWNGRGTSATGGSHHT